MQCCSAVSLLMCTRSLDCSPELGVGSSERACDPRARGVACWLAPQRYARHHALRGDGCHGTAGVCALQRQVRHHLAVCLTLGRVVISPRGRWRCSQCEPCGNSAAHHAWQTWRSTPLPTAAPLPHRFMVEHACRCWIRRCSTTRQGISKANSS